MKKRFILGTAGIVILILLLTVDIVLREKNSKDLLINEVCSNNFSTGLKENYEGCDWIEIYNPTDNPVFLGDYFLSDDRDNIAKCRLPNEYIDADEYLIFYALGTEDNEDFSLNFRISSKGEMLYLSKAGQIVDQVEVPALKTNVTWSRIGEEWSKTEATIGFTNQNAVIISDKQVESPVFSRQGGFYSEDFFLEIEGNGEVFYTLDGSDPDNGDLKYVEPIEIKNISDFPNLYSARTDMSTVSQFIPEELIDKAMIVRAVCIDEDGNASDIITNTYLTGYQEKKAYQEMYTVSLVTDPDNLFSYENGIYVLGEDYDEYMLEDGSMEDFFWIPANYRRRGKKSEREGHIEIWDEKGNEILNRQIGMRVHGSTTRGMLQKSLSIYARELYDGKGVFDEEIFGQNENIRKFFLYSDRDQSKLKHILNQRLIEDREVEIQEFIRCNVFLDGEYWGVYSLAEVYDEYYFQNNYGIDNVEIYEGARPASIVEFINSGIDMTTDQAYEEISKLMDMQSFIDYYGSMIYIDDWDWLPGNARCWRSISEGTSEKEDGKWRWCVWDTEGALNTYDENTFKSGNETCWEEDPIVKGLMQNSNFRRDFVISFMDMVNRNFEENRVLAEIDEMLAEYEESYEKNRIRYFGDRDMSKYADSIKEFFVNRRDRMLTFLKEEFELSEEPVYLVLLPNKENVAEFSVNTITLERSCFYWQGLYFSDYPVTLRINDIDPEEQFLGWYDDGGALISTEQEIMVELGSDTKVVYARFEE